MAVPRSFVPDSATTTPKLPSSFVPDAAPAPVAPKPKPYVIPGSAPARPNLAKLQAEAAASAAEAKKANSVGGFLANFGKAFVGNIAGSEVALGNTIGETIAAPKVLEQKTQADKAHADLLVNLSKAIRAADAAGRDSTKLKQEYNRSVEEFDPKEFNKLLPSLNKTNLQVAGELGGVALDALSAGVGSKVAAGSRVGILAKEAAPSAAREFGAAVAKNIEGKLPTAGAKIVAAGKKALGNAALTAPLGYGYDVSTNLQQGKQNPLTPGLGTAISIAIPGAQILGAASKEIGKAAAPRLINSLIKPLAKDLSYGKNPGRTVAELGITGNNLEDLGKNINQARSTVGESIGQLSTELDRTLAGRVSPGAGLPKSGGLNLEESLNPLNEAMQRAARDNNPTLLSRLQNVKEALTHTLSLDTKGDVPGILKGDPKNLTNANFAESFAFKRQIGDITQFTGNPSDDKLVNGALKQVYGKVKSAIENAADKIDPEAAKKLAKLNEQYADLTSAGVATKYRDQITTRQNIISAPIRAGGIAGGIAAVATGGVGIPALLVGAGIGTLDKLLGTTAVKSRVAAWLGSESTSNLEKFFAAHPGVAEKVYSTFKVAPKEGASALQGASKRVVLPSRGFANVGTVEKAAALGLGATAVAQAAGAADKAVTDMPPSEPLPADPLFDENNNLIPPQPGQTASAATLPTGTYIDPVRKLEYTDDDLGELRKILYGEISNRSSDKRALEAKVIINTALNRLAAAKAKGKDVTLKDILTAKNQYQAYKSKQYQLAEKGDVSGEKMQAVDEAIAELMAGNITDNTNGAKYYIHNKDGSITYDDLRKY